MDLRLQYTVEAWPTFKLFREGRAYEYIGPMDNQQMIEYMKEQEKSPSDEKTTYTSKGSFAPASCDLRIAICDLRMGFEGSL